MGGGLWGERCTWGLCQCGTLQQLDPGDDVVYIILVKLIYCYLFKNVILMTVIQLLVVHIEIVVKIKVIVLRIKNLNYSRRI